MCPEATKAIHEERHLPFLQLRLKSELPNGKLDSYAGELIVGGADKSSILTLEHFLLRGSKLKNTRSVLALVVFTGEETKIRMNSLARRRATVKTSAVEKTMNRMIAGMFVFQIAICVVAGLLAGLWESDHAVRSSALPPRNEHGF